jgi:hypothetical protein
MASAALSAPPALGHSVIAFPERDFVSASGYAAAGGPVTFQLTHANGTTFTSDPITPVDDPKTPGFDGLVEVNHPGGGCWATTTPDVRAGDSIRVTQGADTDQTTVANVTAGRPIQTARDTVQIHGTAQDAAGLPLPEDQVEQRLVANKDTFLLSGRRTLRASFAPGSNGTIAWDAPGSTSWTATYTGLQDQDVIRALGAESRALWLGTTPAAPAGSTEGTIFESGSGIAGGPAAGFCSAPAEMPTTNLGTATGPTGPDFKLSSTQLNYGKFNLGGSNTQTVTVKNSGATNLVSFATSISGTGSAAFTVVNNNCGTQPVLPGKTCSFGVKFTPTARATTYSATLRVDATDAAGTAAPAKFASLNGATN